MVETIIESTAVRKAKVFPSTISIWSVGISLSLFFFFDTTTDCHGREHSEDSQGIAPPSQPLLGCTTERKTSESQEPSLLYSISQLSLLKQTQ